MSPSLKELIASANQAAPKVAPHDATRFIAEEDALLLDVRDPNEVAASGKVKGAINVSRGMLEFRADPEAPTPQPAFRKDRPIIVYCGSGGRAALSCKTLKDMGYPRVMNLGAFKDACEAGLETEPA
jgi:rhodanese-related sulfurtransferase